MVVGVAEMVVVREGAPVVAAWCHLQCKQKHGRPYACCSLGQGIEAAMVEGNQSFCSRVTLGMQPQCGPAGGHITAGCGCTRNICLWTRHHWAWSLQACHQVQQREAKPPGTVGSH
jgi:hypothetical protein